MTNMLNESVLSFFTHLRCDGFIKEESGGLSGLFFYKKG